MRPEEARYIYQYFRSLPVKDVAPILNLGSSTREFREKVKPHIHTELFGPLEEDGVNVLHADMKTGEGVDISGSIYDSRVVHSLREVEPKTVLCCNMMEHIDNPSTLVSIIGQILPQKGKVVVSVPYSYPIHYDPIDTYFRPSPGELAEQFSDYRCLASQVVVSSTYIEDVFGAENRNAAFLKLLRRSITSLYPFQTRADWLRRHHRLLWLFRRYKITIGVFEK